jgi:hypothetical protein
MQERERGREREGGKEREREKERERIEREREKEREYDKILQNTFSVRPKSILFCANLKKNTTYAVDTIF